MEDQISLGLNAYEKLVTKLQELKLDDMVDYLQKNVIDPNKNNNTSVRTETPSTDNSDCITLDSSDDDSSREDNFYTKIQEVREPLSINVKKATKFRDRPVIKHIDVYPMRSNPRGLVLIIANNLYKKQKDRRPSARHDESNLKRLFEEMGFKVITYFDLTGQQIENKIEEFSKLPELRRVDSAFVIISSHGSGKRGHQETEILGIDYNSIGYKKVVCTNIMDHFTAERCRNLTGKPKVFIFQTCRGKNEQIAVPRHTTDAATSSRCNVEEPYVQFSETLRNYEDMLIVYSTIPGYVSYRDHYNGSWFIQVLCEVFMNYAHKKHVQDLFNMIDNRLKDIRTLENNCQTPSITSQGFNKYCYLNPGLFDEKQNGKAEKTKLDEITDTMFKCCPDRKANIQFCTNCESVFHKKCAKSIDRIKQTGFMRVNCCTQNINDNNNDETDSRSLSENVEELKKVVEDLKEENNTLKNQHVNIIACEITSKNSEQHLRMENLLNENELLKQLAEETRTSNNLLKEKNEFLSSKLNKKKKKTLKLCKRNVYKILKKKRKQSSNTINPVEIIE